MCKVGIEGCCSGDEVAASTDQHKVSTSLKESQWKQRLTGYYIEQLQNCKKTLLNSIPDRYKLLYMFGAVTSVFGISISGSIRIKLGRYLDYQPETEELTFLGCACASAYLYSLQTLLLCIAVPCDSSGMPMKLREMPKELLLAGAFISMNMAILLFGVPSLGYQLGAVLDQVISVLGAIAIDSTGMCGMTSRRRLTKGQISGGLVAAAGVLSTMMDDQERSQLHSILPFLGIVSAGCLGSPIGTALSSSMVPFAGSATKATILMLLVSALTMLIPSAVMLRLPNLNLAETEWWMWIGGLAGTYGAWGTSYFPLKLGLSTYIATYATAFNLSYMMSDALGIFVRKRPISIMRLVGVVLGTLGVTMAQVCQGEVIEGPCPRYQCPVSRETSLASEAVKPDVAMEA